MIRLKTTSSSSCGPLNMSACVCVLPSCVRVWLLSCFLLSRKIRLSSAEAAVVLRLFFFQKIFSWFQFSFLFFFLFFLFIYDEEKPREAPLWWTQNFGVHLRPGPSSTRFNGGVTLPRISEYKRRKKGRQKKLLAAPVSRYLLFYSPSLFPTYNIRVCIHRRCRTSCWPWILTAKCCWPITAFKPTGKFSLPLVFFCGWHRAVWSVWHFFLWMNRIVWLWKKEIPTDWIVSRYCTKRKGKKEGKGYWIDAHRIWFHSIVNGHPLILVCFPNKRRIQ